MAWGASVGAHMWVGWGSFAEQPGAIICWKFFFFPVNQFSEHFPWNILTLEFKISAADMQDVEERSRSWQLVTACASSNASGAPGHALK